MRIAFLLIITCLSLTTLAQQTNSFPDNGAAGIGTTTPQFYFHTGTNTGMEIFNPNTGGSSQSHLILSSGATVNTGPVGGISWIAKNATGNKGIAYIGALTRSDNTINAAGELVFATADGTANPEIRMRLNAAGKLSLGNQLAQAYFDVSAPRTNELVSVLARLPEGNNTDGGSYLGIRALNTQPASCQSFALEHKFYGKLNSAINFYRGESDYGGILTFSTNDGTEKMRLDKNGNLGIGTINTNNYRLTVEGDIGAKKIQIRPNGWADFVFEADYQLPSLTETAVYISRHKHLPDLPAASEVAENGIDIGGMNKILVQKIEELTLYLIEQNKEMVRIREELSDLKRK